MKLLAAMASAAIALCLSAQAATADLPALMPLPSTVAAGQGDFVLAPGFTVSYASKPDERLTAAVARTLARLQFSSGVALARAAVVPSGGSLDITVTGPDAPVQGVDEDESYHLAVSPQGIQLKAASVVGAMRGFETLLQLVAFRDGKAVVAGATVDDQPRFRWRGLMIDVARHFEPVDVIKRNLDGMALVKLNVFHWHLSDDQGFRAESKRFPKLTELGSRGEFYTQEQMRDVVAYARARGIRVVPEFDMPGHTVSWQVAYPELASSPGPFEIPDRFGVHDEALDPTRESTYKFLDALVGEMAAIFPDSYFHVGGDESNGKAWLGNPRIVAFMKAHNIADTAALQVYFNAQLLKIVAKHGKHMIGWDEVFTPGLPKDIVIESWRGSDSLAQAAAQGYQGILAAPYYLDGMGTAERHFLADPIPADTKLTPDQQKLILGGEVAMWAEQIQAHTIDSRIWPRAAAIAERFWSPQSDRDVASMYTRLWPISLQLETVGLTHLSGPQKMLRNLAQSQQPTDLETLASVLEPVGFGERYQTQRTDARTPLDRLVDAVVPDPPSRFEIGQLASAALSSGSEAAAAKQALRERFQSWIDAGPALEARLKRSPRLADAAPRAIQLAQLGQAGLQALDALDGKAVASGWKDKQTALLTEAAKPVALTRFTFLTSMQKLVDAAPVTALARENVRDLVAGCGDLAKADFSGIPDAPTHIVQAEIVAPTASEPSYCKVGGFIEPRVGVEMRLPVKNWNGKFMEKGCGGWCGAIMDSACVDALHRGYACITTDMGHKGSSMDDVSWANDNLQGQLDFGYRATHVAALAGKAIAAQYYRAQPKRSYFVGCSTGGYQGVTEAQRFPWDFDGIVAGAPDIDETQANFRALWVAKVQHDPQEHLILGKTELALLHNAALALCDQDDGVKDGIISNPRGCKFKPETLLCKPGETAGCLTREQVDTAIKVYSGPMNSAGELTSTGSFLIGSELGWSNLWSTQSLVDYFRYGVSGYSTKPGFKDTDFDFNRDYKRFGLAPDYDNSNPDLRKLKAAGAKLIIYHGTTDTIDPPEPVIDYYETVEKTMGGRKNTQSFFRLFLIPGMNHCGGGAGAMDADWIGALEEWVEMGKAPDIVVGAHPAHDKETRFTRPLYPYPDYAKYKGSGDVNEAEYFERVSGKVDQ